jgi:MFS family permease
VDRGGHADRDGRSLCQREAVPSTDRVLFAVAAVFAAADGLQRPSLDSIVPRLVPHEQLIAASTLSTFRWTFGSIVGPIAGGTVAVAIGPAAWYAVDAATFAVTLVCFITLAASPPLSVARASLGHIFGGVRYAVARRDLLGTYLIDFSAMLFAFPVALFPFIADRYHETFALGLLYAGLPIGALLASLTSRWTARIHHHGRAIVVAAVCWGLAIAAFGLTDGLALAVLMLMVAGGADAISGIFRQTMWNASIPDEMRGRMAGLELLSYSTGPELGQLRSALVASATSLKASIVSGGLLCAASCAAFALLLPTMWRFDASTDSNVALVRAERAREQGAAT